MSWEEFRESRRCSRDTYPESYITEYTFVYEEKGQMLGAAKDMRRICTDPVTETRPGSL